MEYVVSQTDAVLIKLIPSTQHIHLIDEKHNEFYDALSPHNIPLLCHVGPEYSFPEGMRRRELDNFRYLEKPLDHGVTVIAAHCAVPVFPIPLDAWPHLPWVTSDMTPEEYFEIIKTKNPFDRDVKIKQAHGFSDSIIENSERVLRISLT